MKSEMTLNELAAEITRQEKAKKDYIADTPRLQAAPAERVRTPEGEEMFPGDITLRANGEPWPITEEAHRQLSSKLDIPFKYYQRLRTKHPDVLAHNVNALMNREPKPVMVRTLTPPHSDDRYVRAILSDRYRPMDNNLILSAALPVLRDHQLSIKACNLSPTSLYVQAVLPTLQAEVKPGDVIMAGIIITNSETGHRSLRVEEMVWRLVCSNGQIGARGIRRYHVGKRTESDGTVVEYSGRVHELENETLYLKVGETVQAALDSATWDDRVAEIRNAADRQATRPIPEIVEVVTNDHKLSETEGAAFLRHLSEGGDFSQWGISNGVTRLAQDVPADRAYELEKAGGRIVELTYNQFKNRYQVAA